MSRRKLTLRQIEQKYNLLLDKAKEDYKSSRGLKNARGFNKSDEFKKIAASKNRATKRKLKQIGSSVSSDLFSTYDKSNQKPDSDKRSEATKQAGLKKSPVFWLSDHEIFYLALSYGVGGKVKTLQAEKEQLERQGKEVTVVTFFPDGSSVSTSNEAQFLLNIEKLYTELIELQEKTDKYPTVDILSFGITPQKTVISVRPTMESDWLPAGKKDRHKSKR